MSYESPVAIRDFVSEISEKLTEERDKYIYQQIRTYVDVDKQELIKALQYDRKQYEKGYEDGLEDAYPVAHGHWIPHDKIVDDFSYAFGYGQCSACKKVQWLALTTDWKMNFCPNCGTEMDESEGEQDGKAD